MSQISTMLNAHYAGEINITNYWSVGDTRIETINEIQSGTTNESQPTFSVGFLIIGTNHDDLETVIGIRNKAVITVKMVSEMPNTGYMDSRKYNNSGWDTRPSWDQCARRTWCNNDYYNALPQQLQNLIRSVIKKITKLVAQV